VFRVLRNREGTRTSTLSAKIALNAKEKANALFVWGPGEDTIRALKVSRYWTYSVKQKA